ncbi:YaaR family protein [Effusibacillus pohliae]|uniref:YaaR family protein n=1 Tax=Effusibacillus pohliae TaxID=232270 RepID=UPI00037B5785|nr:YaaR family protein [Effusibacillus pohliae]
MKIDRRSGTFIEQLGLREEKQAGDAHHPAFQDILSLSSERLQKAELDRLLRSIDQLGKELSQQCSWRALMNYKERIRRFLEEVVKGGYGIKERQGTDRRGRIKLYKIVSEIDELMAQLAEEVLKEEQNQLEILRKIGDIRGLLVNLCS